MNVRFYRLENNFAADSDERQRIYLHEISVESPPALEAQREVLTREAAEEFHRRDIISQGMMRTLECESLSEAATQREGSEQTRDYLLRSLNASNEE